MGDSSTSAKKMTDKDLVKRLKEEFNYECGPITETTRDVYIKKLEALIREKNKESSRRRTTIASATYSPVNGQSSNQRASTTPTSGSSIRSSLRNASRRPTAAASTSYLADDSDNRENGDTTTPAGEDLEKSRNYRQRARPVSIGDELNATGSTSKNLRNRTVGTPPAPRLSGVSNTSKRKTLASFNPSLATYSSAESSGDEEEEELQQPSHGAVLYNYITAKSKNSHFTPGTVPSTTPQSTLVAPRPSSKVPFPRVGTNSRLSLNDAKASPLPVRRSPRIKPLLSSLNVSQTLANFSDSETENEPGVEGTQSIRDQLLKHRPLLGRRNDLGFKKPSGGLPPPAKDFSDESTSYSPSSNGTSSSSNWISVTILCLVIFFFVFILSFYFYSRISFTLFGKGDKSKVLFNSELGLGAITAPICTGVDFVEEHCFPTHEHVKACLFMVKVMQDHIKRQALGFLCSGKASKENDPFTFGVHDVRNVVLLHQEELKEFLGFDPDDKIKIFNDAILLIGINKQLGIQVVKDDVSIYLRINPDDFVLPLPLTCRAYLFVARTLKQIGLSILVIVALWSIYKYVHRKKKQVLEEREMIYDLVEKSLELLQSPDNPQSVPVLHIRDMLLLSKDRKDAKKMKIWSKVVKFIEENESRVKVDLENIDGEDYKTWKWIAANKASPCGDPENGSTIMKTGTIEWQGQAFGDENRSKLDSTLGSVTASSDVNSSTPQNSNCQQFTSVSNNFVAPTCFLKVRNMFDREILLDPNWKANIQNAILEKCSNTSPTKSHGVNHIYIDEKNTNEGVVYIKCDSIDSATVAFRALHGWWCERKLVSVKFLKEERYYSRFPEAKSLNLPLRYVHR